MGAYSKTKTRNSLWVGLGAALLALALLVGMILCAAAVLPQLLLPGAIQFPFFFRSGTALSPNPYGPEDFQYDENGFLTCVSGPSSLGVDVSSHQGRIDWQAVADAGVEFVMIRAGYRGYETGLLHQDSMAQENYKGAKAAGLKVGAYFFSQATSTAEALEEAQFLLNILRGWQLDLPVVCDWEHMGAGSRTANVDGRTVTDCLLAFGARMDQAGLESMIYFNPHHARNYIYLEELAKRPFWLALYTDQMTYDYRVDLWQYTNAGSVPGISGNVDMNLWLK